MRASLHTGSEFTALVSINSSAQAGFRTFESGVPSASTRHPSRPGSKGVGGQARTSRRGVKRARWARQPRGHDERPP